MKSRSLSPLAHWILLCLFAVLVFCVVMLPVVLMGYPYWLSEMILQGRTLVETGSVINFSARLMVIIVALLHPLIAWDNIVAWTGVSAAGFALALLPWWWCIRRLFGVTAAWFSTVVLSLLPAYWIDALDLGGYSFALFFLFLCFASFIALQERHRFAALALSGVFFGLVLASHDAFNTFLPWFVVAYAWHERKHLISAAFGIALFLGCAYIAFAAPLFPNAMLPGMTPVERVQVFLPSLKNGTPGEGHLYPDEYIFKFYKEEYDAIIEKRVEGAGFFERQEDAHYRLIFGVGAAGILLSLANGVWLFLNQIPSFFMMETVGGALLWIFIAPGIVVLRRKNRSLLYQIIGLWLSMEFFLRFVLHFGRLHLEDVAWALALFAGLGVTAVLDALPKEWKPRAGIIGLLIACVIGTQMLQANRKLLAFNYGRSYVPEIYAAAEALKKIPVDAVVANPRRRELFFFSSQTPVTIHSPTVDFLAERGKLAEPFRYYKATYIMGYSDEQTALIQKAVPGIKVVEIPKVKPPNTVTPLVHYLLHVIR